MEKIACFAMFVLLGVLVALVVADSEPRSRRIAREGLVITDESRLWKIVVSMGKHDDEACFVVAADLAGATGLMYYVLRSETSRIVSIERMKETLFLDDRRRDGDAPTMRGDRGVQRLGFASQQ